MSMTTPALAAGQSGAEAIASKQRPYADWSAVIAGAVVAAAVFTVLTTFGTAIGLSATSVMSGRGLSATALAVASGLWLLWISVSSFMVGAYMAGRLRHRDGDASAHEIEVRDGSHGLMIWALGTLLVGWLAASSVAGLAKGAASVAATGAAAASAGISQKLTDMADPMTNTVDKLLRSQGGNPASADAGRQEMLRILSTSVVSGTLAQDDKAYLASRVAAATGIPLQEASTRIDDAQRQLNEMAAKAKETAESARRIGVLIGFLTAASLLVSAAAAWWAATMGGKHRDEGTDHSHLIAWR